MNWLKELFNAIDKSDAETFTNFLTKDARFKFGNAETILGKDNIEDVVDQFFSAIKKTEHTLENTWVINNHVFVQGSGDLYTP